jgi:MerR family mercuric resistance operon transcriptional regulator
LNEIANLLSLNDRPCSQVQDLAEHKLSAVKEKMADLKRLEKALKLLLSQCQSNDDDSHCPIIDSLQP